MRKIVITGANGFIGRKLIRRLLDKTDYMVVGIASCEEKLENALKQENIEIHDRIQFVSNQDFLKNGFELHNTDVFVHLAFSRSNRSYEQIAASMDYAAAVFHTVAKSAVGRFINLSSQAVYGNTSEIRTEATVPAPESVYATAKYATEIIFDVYFQNTSIKSTNVRLDSVAQCQKLIQALCKQAKYDGTIKLKGGNQRFSYIDIEDTVSSLVNLIQYDGPWERVYNIGLNNGRITLVQLAEKIAAYSEIETGNPVKIDLDECPIELWSGMDSSLFTRDTGWVPQFGIDEIIAHIYATV